MASALTPAERAAIEMSAAVAATIQEAEQIPSGHLYAACMGQMDLRTYNAIIDLLIDAKLVRKEPSHLLVWIGPDKLVASD